MDTPQDITPTVYTEDPYSPQSIAFKRGAEKVELTQSASQLIADPLYNAAGKALGIDMIHDWNKYHDKVYAIVEWAKLRSGKTDVTDILNKMSELWNESPRLSPRKLDSLYITATLQMKGTHA